MTFAAERDGTLRPERGERHDEAERGVTEQGLRSLGFVDAFRAVHGWKVKERSWTYPNGGGYRLDHVLVRGARTIRAAAYAPRAAPGRAQRPQPAGRRRRVLTTTPLGRVARRSA
jgi:hypothetical protein